MKNNIYKWDNLEKSLNSLNSNIGGMVDGFVRPFFTDGADLMKTDVKETDKEFVMDIEMPGYEKSDINIELEDGNIVVKAEKKENKEEEGKNQYVRRERSMSCSRVYYVGDVNEESIKAKYENGILQLNIPKKEEIPEKKHSINIE